MIPNTLIPPLRTRKQITGKKEENIKIYHSSEPTYFPNNNGDFVETSTIPIVTHLKTNVDKKEVPQGIISSNKTSVQRSQIRYGLTEDVDVSIIPMGRVLSGTNHD